MSLYNKKQQQTNGQTKTQGPQLSPKICNTTSEHHIAKDISNMLLSAVVAVAFSATVAAHTSFTTLFVNGIDQGDGTCVRQPTDPQTSTFPIQDLTTSDMVCGGLHRT